MIVELNVYQWQIQDLRCVLLKNVALDDLRSICGYIQNSYDEAMSNLNPAMQSPHVRRKSVLPGTSYIDKRNTHLWSETRKKTNILVDPTVLRDLQAHRSLDDARGLGHGMGHEGA